MDLQSARFRGDPLLQRIADADQSAYLSFGARGEPVRKVQYALIDLGYSIPDGATGLFASQTSAAVVKFKTEFHLVPNNPVVGVGTITALDGSWAVPFADREEFLSWTARPIQDFNFTRRDEFNRRNLAGHFTFHPLSAWVPDPFKAALITGLTGLLDPHGSPDGPFTPSATWGASPMDLYHCHVVVDIGLLADPGWSVQKTADEAIHRRMLEMLRQADAAGTEGTPPWTAAYRTLLLAGSPNFLDRYADLLRGIVATSLAQQQTVRLVWHSFEHQLWRPAGMQSNDPRRGWWNDVCPAPGRVTRTPFAINAFGANVLELTELALLVDRNLVITVLGQTLTETSALVGLDKKRTDAAALGLPYP
jgi:peptidoglycan hydrolase-like protein with peptidoglycan-binding domain